jgi:hypothetical protein
MELRSNMELAGVKGILFLTQRYTEVSTEVRRGFGGMRVMEL